MASRFRVLAVVLIAAVVALLWVPAAGAASDVAGQPPALHLYDGHDRESVRTAATTGPPVAFDHTATPEAVDRQSCGSSASPSARTSPAIYNYGDTALPARTARGSHGVEGSNRGGTAACAVVQRLSVAAKAEVPLIKAGSAGGESAGKVFPQAVKDAARAENPGTCVFCRMDTKGQVDHAIPRARGGNATLDNAQIACPWCNASKGARDFPVNPPPGCRGDWPPAWWGLP